MSGRQRVLVIAVGVVIVLLFAASVATQGRGGPGGRDSGESGPVALLERWFGGTVGADPDDVTADCQEPDGRLVFGGSCTVEVAPADRSLRLVRLAAQHPVSVEAPTPVGDFTVATELDPGETVRVAVGPDGAEIELDCADPDDCVVLIGAGGGDRDG
jgi:hypothetical protein